MAANSGLTSNGHVVVDHDGDVPNLDDPRSSDVTVTQQTPMLPQSPASSNHIITKPVGKVKSRVPNLTLERESQGWVYLLVYCSIFVIFDVARQTCSYSLRYLNDGQYPLPQTVLVCSAELVKLVIFTCRMTITGKLCATKLAMVYIVPSFCYAVNNNLYFYALYYTTPPMWNILMQARLIFTALVYRFYFKRKFAPAQWFAMLILIAAIVLTQFSNAQAHSVGNGHNHLMIALLLALLGSLVASIGPVYTEYLFKNDDRPFDEKQLQMYLFGSVVAGAMDGMHRYQIGSPLGIHLDIRQEGSRGRLILLLLVVVLFSSLGGIVAAFIMKKLDNIVKLYAQAISSVLTTLTCVLAFPLAFQFDLIFVVCLVLTLFAVYLYESKGIAAWQALVDCASSCSRFDNTHTRHEEVSRDNVKWVRYSFYSLVVGVGVTAAALMIWA